MHRIFFARKKKICIGVCFHPLHAFSFSKLLTFFKIYSDVFAEEFFYNLKKLFKFVKNDFINFCLFLFSQKPLGSNFFTEIFFAKAKIKNYRDFRINGTSQKVFPLII